MDFNQVLAAIRHCRRLQALRHGKSLHAYLIKIGKSHNVYAACNLMSMYGSCFFLENARKLFDEMRDRNIVTWTTMASAYTSCGEPHGAISLYNHMLDSKAAVPNGFMYSVVLKACGLLGEIKLCKLIHKRIFEEKLDSDIVLINTLLDTYVKCGSLDEARQVFDRICATANTTTWNIIISGYCKEGSMEEALKIFNNMPEPNAVSWNSVIAGFTDHWSSVVLKFVSMMHSHGLKLDGFTFPRALKSCSYLGFLAMGQQIHCYVVKTGFACSCFTVSALVDMYSNCNQLNEAVELFSLYSVCNDSVSNGLPLWNSMLSGFVINGQNIAAFNLLLKIYLSDACMDSYTLSSTLKLCINLLNLRLGSQVHGLVVVSGYELDYVVGSVVVDLYAKLGKVKDGFELFQRLPKKDSVAWSGLIMGSAEMGLNLLAFELFRNMLNLDLDVDEFIISNILKVCSSLGHLKSGKQLHAFCVKSGYETEAVIVTTLINMYSKCGEIDDGLTLFHSVPDKDVVCWTGIIVGCGQNGRAKEAIEFYQQMVRKGLKPNEVTFLGFLTACRHAGYVKEACAVFESMKHEHKLVPQIEHYYCIVDLFAQAGCFREAEKLIAEMPFKPDKTIWSSLLAACCAHRNTELISSVEENLLATAPDDPSIYVMLSNAYAELNMWDKLRKMREQCKQLGMRKAGKSWIEISN